MIRQYTTSILFIRERIEGNKQVTNNQMALRTGTLYDYDKSKEDKYKENALKLTLAEDEIHNLIKEGYSFFLQAFCIIPLVEHVKTGLKIAKFNPETLPQKGYKIWQDCEFYCHNIKDWKIECKECTHTEPF